MPRAKPPTIITATPPPFIRAFPRLSTWILFGLAALDVIAGLCLRCWPWRRELLLAAILCGAWVEAGQILPIWPALALVLGAAATLGAAAPVRRWLLGWLRCSRTRRQLLTGFAETRAANPSGRLPRVSRLSVTAVGERVQLTARPGHSAELLDARVEELRAAVRSREVRITRDPNRSHRISIDVVRRDPLTATADIAWADLDVDVLSMWHPVAVGVDEAAEPLRVSLVERGLIGAGEPGSGKSSLGNVIVSHAAKSPDAHLVLIDPNEVQFAPWRDRALAFASDDPGDALAVLDLVRDEVRRRLALLRTLPGVVRKVTRDVAAEHGLPLWLFAIDELAFHTSVVGTPAQRAAFNTACRDIVARSRAAGVIPVAFTQRPTADVVPTSLRDLFSLRCAFRTTTRASSDVILGEGWARQGYSATDVDITARGVGWLLAEGQQPQRFKGAWLPDATIAELSITTIRHRPPAPPGLAGLGPPIPPWPRPTRTRPIDRQEQP